MDERDELKRRNRELELKLHRICHEVDRDDRVALSHGYDLLTPALRHEIREIAGTEDS